MYISAIRQTDGQARANYTYQADGAQDQWRSHADDVLAGRAWADDCDGLASTVIDLLIRQGTKMSDLYRLLVSTSGNGVVDHMVAAVRSDNGDFWIVGDCNRPVYSAETMTYGAVAYNRMSETQPHPIWRQGLPWRMA